MSDLSELTNMELYTHLEWCSDQIDMMNSTGQDPVNTDVWAWYEEALDEADRRETITSAWRYR